ncbi:hypothetical protein, partial [Marilutibacter maris]|uniref:hypothetical protein n=1 Tax=Marilutibacter maris TaxID=1605891 RepID=UPI001B877013
MRLEAGGTAPKLAALKHGRLYGRRPLRCAAGFKSLKVKVNSRQQWALLNLLALGQPALIADPEGGAHGRAPFFGRARMASRKILGRSPLT